MGSLEAIKKQYELIVKNQLKSDAKVVFGEGCADARIMLVGEAPGAKEELYGKPFIGQAGKILDEFLDILGIEREDIYITNVVKIRPFKINANTKRKSNRPPNRSEIELSIGTLIKQIEMIKPEVVVTLGNVPLKALVSDNEAKIGNYHGRPVRKNDIIIFPLYHPASIIYNRSLRDCYREDVYKLKNYINSLQGGNMIEK